MNEHKFYNEYIKPVLEEIQKELKERDIDSHITSNRLIDANDDTLVAYYAGEGEYYVRCTIFELFSNKFDNAGYTKELVFKELQPKMVKSIYNLVVGDVAYYIDPLGKCEKVTITKDDWYQRLLHNNNLYLTEEECEKQIAKNQAIAKIKERTYELQGDWKPDWNNIDEQKYYIKYDHMDNQLMITSFLSIKHIGICFKSQHIATQITRELHKECKLMLEVDECTKN